MSNKLTSIKGFGEGDPKPERKSTNDTLVYRPNSGGKVTIKKATWKGKLFDGKTGSESRTPNDAKNKAIHAKMEAKPTGGKMRVGSRTHAYWQDIKRRGEESKKYGD